MDFSAAADHPCRCKTEYADVVELVDSLDLGSNARACRFESCHPHQIKKRRHWPSLFISYRFQVDSNPSKCRCPVDICCHQFKNWWLLYILQSKMAIESCHPHQKKSTLRDAFLFAESRSIMVGRAAFSPPILSCCGLRRLEGKPPYQI